MKILIIGMLGSGKSTLAYELSRHFSLPRLNLDEVSRDPQTGAYRSDEDCCRRIDEFARRCSDWVAEGSQQKLYCRLSPDLIIHTDVSRFIAAWRFTRRFFKAYRLIGKNVDPNLPVQPYHYRRPTVTKILQWDRCNGVLNREIKEYTASIALPVIKIKSRRDYPALFRRLKHFTD